MRTSLLLLAGFVAGTVAAVALALVVARLVTAAAGDATMPAAITGLVLVAAVGFGGLWWLSRRRT